MRVVIFQDRRGEWRFRVLAKNGRVLADSGEGYKTERGVRRACTAFSVLCATELARVKFAAPTAVTRPAAK